MQINKIIKKIIEGSGYNQKEVAEKMNEFPQNISNWIKKSDLPLSKYIEMCAALNINPSDPLDDKSLSDNSGIDPRWLPILREIETKFSTDDKIILMEHILDTVKKIRKIKENK